MLKARLAELNYASGPQYLAGGSDPLPWPRFSIGGRVIDAPRAILVYLSTVKLEWRLRNLPISEASASRALQLRRARRRSCSCSWLSTSLLVDERLSFSKATFNLARGTAEESLLDA